MSITTVTAPASTDRSAAAAARLALLALSFVVGRVTASTTHGSTSIVPAAHTSAGVDDCPRLRYC